MLQVLCGSLSPRKDAMLAGPGLPPSTRGHVYLAVSPYLAHAHRLFSQGSMCRAGPLMAHLWVAGDRRQHC